MIGLGGVFVQTQDLVTDHLRVRSGTLLNLNGHSILVNQTVAVDEDAWIVSVPLGTWAWTWTRWRFRWAMALRLVRAWKVAAILAIEIAVAIAFFFIVRSR